jgi:N-acetylglucosaminyldiphosphoundecaprenol N-acetyl-beta-D-mannosaminyltransferase
VEKRREAAVKCRPPMQQRIRMGRLWIDVIDFAGALAIIEKRIQARVGGTIFTPNVDHVVLVERDRRFRDAYARAYLSLVDGTPVLWAARLLGCNLPEKVSGSDLVVPLAERAAARGWRVFLLGGGPGVGALAASKLEQLHPDLNIVGMSAPVIDMDGDPAARRALAAEIAATRPDLVLVALGTPKQEIFCDEVQDVLAPAVLLGIGAGIDFVAGTARRAPRWVSTVGLEWAYRLIREPRRLAGRYLLRDPEFLAICARQWLRGADTDPRPLPE